MPFIVAVSGKEPESYDFAQSLAEYLRAHGGCRNSAVCPTSENCLNRTARVTVLGGETPSPVEKAHEIIDAGEAEYVLAVGVNNGTDAVISPLDDVAAAAERLLDKLGI